MAPISYQNFDLLIDPVNGIQNRYSVRVISSPSGEDTGSFDLPFTTDQLAHIHDVGLLDMKTAEEFGKTLFNLVFANEIRTCLERSFDAVSRTGQRLRLRLRLTDTSVLPELPWELLFDQRRNLFILSSTVKASLVRYLDLPEATESLPVSPPVKILVMIANLPDNHYPALDTEIEWQNIRNALLDLEQQGQVMLTRLETGSLKELKNQLRQDQYHIFHYVGHGNFNSESQKGSLILEDGEGHPFEEDGQHLGVLLHDHRSLRLVLLNSCQGARFRHTRPFGGVARCLVQQGVPAVIAMQFEITDKAAITFSHEFYAALAKNCSVDEALAEARQSIYIDRNSIEWATPVLYMRTSNSQLFSVNAEHTGSEQNPIELISKATILTSSREAMFKSAGKDISEPFPRLWELPLGLAQLYKKEDSIRRIVVTAGLKEHLVSFSSSSVDTWYSVVSTAAKLYKIKELFKVALTDFGSNPWLQEMYRDYLSAANQGKNPDISIELQSVHAEYKEWALIHNQRMQDLLSSLVTSEPEIGGELSKLWENLDGWLSDWQNKKVFVLHGEQDLEVTLGVANWLDRNISRNSDFPPVLFVSAKAVVSTEPKELVLDVVKPNGTNVVIEEWQRNVTQWIELLSSKNPTFLIVIHDIDESQRLDSWWLALLQNLLVDAERKDESSKDPYIKNIAVILTCSTEYWYGNLQELPKQYMSVFDLSWTHNQPKQNLADSQISQNNSNEKIDVAYSEANEKALLLVGHLIEEYGDGQRNLAEVATKWLEIYAQESIDQICEKAVLRALSRTHIVSKIKQALLLIWLNGQNSWQDTKSVLHTSLCDYVEDYLAFFEYVWISEPRDSKARSILLSAFCELYSQQPKVRNAVEKAVERWLGMVHIAGFPHQRGNKSEKTDEVTEKVNERVGFKLQLGNNFTFAGRTLIAIDDDKLLRLGRAALALISHLPRGPFIHSIATGCVAEAIMDYPEKYDLFRWVLSTAPGSVWGEVRQEVDQLLSYDSPAVQQAAHRLLSFEGGKQAYTRQNSLPDNLFPKHFLHIEHEKDPCLSLFAWSKSTCESCLQRSELEAQYLARRMESHALDPSLRVPEELQRRFAALAENIDISQIWSTMSTGVQDLAYDRYEAALCAVSPQAIANTVRSVVRQVATRSGLALHQISFRLREHALLFEQEELDSIYQVWQQLQQSASNWEEEQKTAEMMLFSLVLSRLNGEEQLAHLLQRPEDVNIDMLQYEDYFLSINDWEMVEKWLTQYNSEHGLTRILWFISIHAEQIPPAFLVSHIMPYVEDNSAQVRRLAMKVIYNADNRYVNFAVVGGWERRQDNLDEENLLGSFILCQYGHLLPVEILYERIHPRYWGYAVKCRGSDIAELDLFANKLHVLWKHIRSQTLDIPQYLPETNIEVSTETSGEKSSRPRFSLADDAKVQRWDLAKEKDSKSNRLLPLFPTEEEINAQQARDIETVQAVTEQEIALGNPWFARHFEMDALEDVVLRRPDLLEKWLQAVSEQNEHRLRVLRRCHSFYEALCRVLLKIKPKDGIALYSQMEQVNISSREFQTKWNILDRALFQADPATEITELWEKKLDACTTDKQLLMITSMLQWGSGAKWLWGYIEQQMASSTPIGISRGITLLGIHGADKAKVWLDQLYQDAPDTWRKQLLETSIQRWNLNNWSRHWFSQIFASDTNVEAWAAFRLFLRCVDSRFWLWYKEKNSIGAAYPQFEQRWRHIEINWETIRNRIRKNEDEFEKKLFGQKILRNQAWPWM